MDDAIEQAFDRAGIAVGEGVVDAGQDRGELFGSWSGGGVGDQAGQLVAAVAQLAGSFAVLGDAIDGAVVVEAVFDGTEQVVDLGVDAGEFGVDGGQFVLVAGAHAVDGVGDGSDGFVDEVGALVDLPGGVKDGVLDLVGGEPFTAGAGVAAVAVVGEAGVVTVPVELAVGSVAEVPLAAVGAGHVSGEGVVGADVGAFGVVVSAGDEDLLGLFEQVCVDERVVVAFGAVPRAAEVDLAEVGTVAKHGEDGFVAPGFAGLGA